MSDTEIVLFAGTPATDDPDDKWLPSLTLDHDANRRELYVIVCEEAAGMAEGVPVEVFEAVRDRIVEADRLRVAADAAMAAIRNCDFGGAHKLLFEARECAAHV